MSATVGCPECGAEVRFTTPGAVLCVCSHCSSVVAKRGLDYSKLGKVAQLAEVPSPLYVGLSGKAHGGFRVVGRVQLDHGAGTWNEWYLALENGRWLWLAETQGRFYLSMPLGPVDKMPAFELIHVGRTLPIPTPDGDKTLRVNEVNTAKLVSAEGELPFEVVPGQASRYVDLSGPKGAFGTLDYGPPGHKEVLGFYGNQIRFESLEIDRGSFTPPPPRTAKAGKRMSCPSCDGALALKAPDTTLRVTCPYCRALVDVSAEPLKALSTLKKVGDHLKPIFELGKKGTLRGKEYTVLGHLRRDIVKGGQGYWDEYLLWTGESSDSAYHYLIFSGGHFTLAEPIGYGDIQGYSPKKYMGTPFRHVEKCSTRVSHIAGEFPWAVEVGEKTEVDDSANAQAGMLLSIEASEDSSNKEVNASIGYYLDSEEVWKAFGLSGRTPMKEWVAPHQPNPYEARWARQKSILFWATLAMFGLLGWSCGRSGHYAQTFKLETVPGTEPAAEHIFISEPFELGKKGQQFGVDVQLRAEVSNSWAAADVTLINDEDGQVFSAPLEVAYYSGYSDGESWSEGSKSASAVVPSVPGGKYVVRIEPAWPTIKQCTSSSDCDVGFYCSGGSCSKTCVDENAVNALDTPLNRSIAARFPNFKINSAGCGTGHLCIGGKCMLAATELSVKLRYPTTRPGYAFLLWLLMALVPAWTFMRMRQFEQQRSEDA